VEAGLADNFNSPANATVNVRNWQFGTGEVETMTVSQYNIHLDGHGNLDIIVLGADAVGGDGPPAQCLAEGRPPPDPPGHRGSRRSRPSAACVTAWSASGGPWLY
jgi:hypothetical protein